MFIAGIVGALIAIVVVVVAMNFVTSESEIQTSLEHRYGVGDPQFRRELGILLGPAIIDGNQRASTARTATRSSPRCSAAIRGGRDARSPSRPTSTGRATSAGRSPTRSRNAPAPACKVHVLLDWVGSQKIATVDDRRHDGGGRRDRSATTRCTGTTSARMNNRTHRKLLVVDGRIGFTGGVGIADDWDGDAQDAEHWRDSHYRVEGPAVAQMQAAFMDNWIKTTGKVLQGAGVLSPRSSRRATALGAGVHQLAERRRRQHAADVPAVDRPRPNARIDLVGGLFRS